MEIGVYIWCGAYPDIAAWTKFWVHKPLFNIVGDPILRLGYVFEHDPVLLLLRVAGLVLTFRRTITAERDPKLICAWQFGHSYSHLADIPFILGRRGSPIVTTRCNFRRSSAATYLKTHSPVELNTVRAKSAVE